MNMNMNMIERFHVVAPDTSAGGGNVVGLSKGNSGQANTLV